MQLVLRIRVHRCVFPTGKYVLYDRDSATGHHLRPDHEADPGGLWFWTPFAITYSYRPRVMVLVAAAILVGL